jgi:hypothetical protein
MYFRDKVIRVKNLDLMLGPIVVNLEEKLLAKKKPSASTVAEQKDEPSVYELPRVQLMFLYLSIHKYFALLHA